MVVTLVWSVRVLNGFWRMKATVVLSPSLLYLLETEDSALWHCSVCCLDPPAHGFENFITHLSTGDHKVMLSLPRNTVPRPPVDLSRGIACDCLSDGERYDESRSALDRRAASTSYRFINKTR
ncbi:unnamed protein product [Arabidopsis thaliana]|uniref:(thale cress) hypothetical protein n=1 Tax=Arabidopsis thaliana TaxID=3702 RepID=A0A7G2DQR7_ARATH|nr:unnamed protein product [Arabidopsis thaliana]